MKKRKLNLWLNIICITLCIGAIAFGVYSAKNVQLTIGGTIGFYAYADAYVECKIEGGRLKDGEYTGEAYYLTEENSISTTQQSIGLSKSTPTIDFSDITFAKDPTTKVILPLTFTFTITTDSPFTIVTDLNMDNVIFNNVTYTWDTDAVQIIRPEDSEAVEDNSVVKTGTISITMSVIDNQTTTDAIQGNMQLTVKPATTTATDEGFVMSGNCLQSVPSTGENTITIPSYVYDGTSYIKVKEINNNSDSTITNISEYYNVIIENGPHWIGSYSFNGCSNLKNITIPSSITNIGICSFQETGLTNLSFPTGSALENIFTKAFYKCKDLVCELVIPAGVKNVYAYAFSGCSGVTGLVFKSGNILESIRAYAFSSNTQLCGVISIPSSVTSVEEYAFSGCTNITEVVFNDNSKLTSLGGYAFYICTNLETVSFGSNSALQSIGGYAFNGCTNLTNIVIPKNVTIIKERAFAGRCALKNFSFEENSMLKTIEDAAFHTSGITSIELPNGLSDVRTYVFASCLSLTSVTIPNSMTSIPDHTFAYSGLTSITIPASITTIGNSAFYECSKLETLTFASGSQLETVGKHAFYYCNKITGTLTIPAGVKTLDVGSFQLCSGLTKLEFASGSVLETIGTAAFEECYGFTSITIPSTVTYIGEYAFQLCNNMSCSITIPAGVTTIGNYAFKNCNKINSLTFADNSILTTIGAEAFKNCTALVGTITIPASVTDINDSAFESCTSLTRVLFGSGSVLTTLGTKAFYNCFALTGTVEIPKGVTTINDSTFQNCAITGLAFETDSVLTTIGNHAFNGCDALAGSITFPKTITHIGTQAFYKCKALEGVSRNYSTNDLTINAYAFAECPRLASVGLVQYATAIGEYAFANSINSLYTTSTSITIKCDVSKYAFNNCSGIAKLTFDSSGITNIGDSAFNGCSKLKTVSFNSTVTALTDIGESAFEQCENLTSIKFPSSIMNLGVNAFKNCYRLNTVTIPSGISTGSKLFNASTAVFVNCYRLVLIKNLSSVTIDSNAIGYSAYCGLLRYALYISTNDMSSGVYTNSDGCICFNNPSSGTYVTTLIDVDYSVVNNVTEISSDITVINRYAFYGYYINQMELHSGITEIGAYAFAYGFDSDDGSVICSLSYLDLSDFYSILSSNSVKWNLYADGSTYSQQTASLSSLESKASDNVSTYRSYISYRWVRISN